MKNKVITLLLIITTLFLVGCSTSNNEPTNLENKTNGSQNNVELNLETECLKNEGKWIESAQECEGISEESCEMLNGEFNACESSCRNDPNAEICTLECVLVCKFEKKESNENSLNQILDYYSNEVPKSCENWFDGCNNCLVMENGGLACTKKYCPEEYLEEPSCLKFK